ncbi:phospholipase-like protein [Tanacetum coccineum]
MLIGMANMTQQAPLGTVENVLVKIDKFVFQCDFVVIDMSGILGEMIALGRPFLATIHAQIDVFNGEILFGISEDSVKFDVNKNSTHPNATFERVYMETSSQEEESFNLLELGDNLFSYESPAYNERITSRWHVYKPFRVFYDDGSGEDCRIWPTCNPELSFCSRYEAVYGKGEHKMLKQWVCFRDHKRRNVKGICMEFADFLHVRHTNIANSDQEKVFNKWVLDSFDVEDDYAKKFANPYSRKFDKYRRVFNNEVEQLSNEYILRIGKKGYVLDDVWEKCIRLRKEKSFICITKKLDDDLPLGRTNWSRFAKMIRDELGTEGTAQGAT